MTIERVMNYIDAVQSLAPDKFNRCSENGEVIWKDDATGLPTEVEIQAEIVRLQASYDALAYSRSRQAEYPSLLELTVALYDTSDQASLIAKRAAVKAKYPKPA